MRHVPAALAASLAIAALLCGRPAEAAGESEFAARQILVRWAGAERSDSTATREEARAKAEAALAEARRPGADFEALARTRSDEKETAAKGGFLGVFGRGTTAPEFEKALEGLRDGEVSGLVETPYGFHVIQRLSVADGRRLLAENTVVFQGALFDWKEVAPPGKSQRAKAQALADATKAAELLRAGMPMVSLPPGLDAKPFRKAGGSWLPYVLYRGTIRPEFRPVETAASALTVGQVSNPVETPLGWIVMRRLPFFHARVQHILVQHIEVPGVPDRVRLPREQAKARAEEAWAKVKADPSSWDKVVAAYSDEGTTSARGGDLGWIEPGRMLPEFDAVVAALAPGAVSTVVETRYGFHVVRRLD